jgi:prepilin-type processing-associated H-X9-DG protein
VDEHGAALFVISDEPVSFGRMARLFRNRLGCRNALYLDGSVSSLWDPGNGRMDSFAAIGPMIVALRGR